MRIKEGKKNVACVSDAIVTAYSDREYASTRGARAGHNVHTVCHHRHESNITLFD